jgi:fucose 4-O-acetylase-like acetyltransferase
MTRLASIDAAKGIGISLVVFGHVLGGAIARHWLSADGLAQEIYDFIYLFHMPLFFLLSGALSINLVRSDPPSALWSRVGSVAWPYVLWGAISIASQPLLAPYMPNHFRADRLTEDLFRLASGQLSWFLWTLFVCHLILLLAAKVNLWIMLIVSTILGMVVPDQGPVGTTLHYLPFVVLGATCSGWIVTEWKVPPALAWAASFALFSLLAITQVISANRLSGFYILQGLTGSLGCMLAAQNLSSPPIGPTIAKIGAASLAVFLLHPYFQGAARELAFRVLGANALVQLSFPTLVAILGPVLVLQLSDRFNMRWLFRLNLARRRPLFLEPPTPDSDYRTPPPSAPSSAQRSLYDNAATIRNARPPKGH